jgi:hypothetical protein
MAWERASVTSMAARFGYNPSMPEKSFEISFRDCTADEANAFSEELQQDLQDADSTVSLKRRKDNEQSQDFGATLVLVLGTGAITAVAKGFSAWIARNSGAKVVITKDGSVVAENIDSRDAARIVADALKR